MCNIFSVEISAGRKKGDFFFQSTVRNQINLQDKNHDII